MIPSENSTFEIQLPQFKGPFDLLLFFIERDELDIYDIPIHTITEEFLVYIQKMQEFNMEVASEFILVAATLMKIKAQMLLPRKKLDDEGNEIDPREELVQKILEYKQFKEISLKLAEIEDHEMLKMKRSGAEMELKVIADLYRTELEMEHVTVNKLYTVFEKLLRQKATREDVSAHEVKFVEYSIEDEKSIILNKLFNGQLTFEILFEHINLKVHAIYHFLAILELVQENKVKLTIGEGTNNFWISKTNDEESETV
ncbi:MAG: segregation and condensation protein A [Chitinophagales bacterium]